MGFSFDDYNWTVVSDGGVPTITVSSLGIAFNNVSIDRLGKPEKIIMGFNEENLTLAIKPYEGEPNTKPYTFGSRVKNNWIRVGCKKFVSYLSEVAALDFTTSKKYIADNEPGSNVLTIKIQTAMKIQIEENGFEYTMV